MHGLKLIRELNEDVQHITETIEESGKTNHYLCGTYMQAGVKNRNGREYPIDVLANEANRYFTEIVKENRGYGELGHPNGPQINLDRVAILIKELKQDNNNFVGKALVTETPMGQIVKGLLEGGAKLGVSSRALGSLKESEGRMIVQPDLKLIAVDVVADPSAPNAFVEGIMENAEWIEDGHGGWTMLEAAQKVKKRVKRMSKREINEQKVALFEDFVASIIAKTS